MSAPPELPQTLPYHLASQIQRGIIRGRYPSGSNLRELDLLAEYGSSRGPIREGLRVLELQGLVVHSPRKGFRVKDYTAKEVEHLYRMRANLESVVVDALAETDTKTLARELDRINEAMKVASDAGDLDKYFDFNIEFHQLIIDFAASSTLSRVLSIVNDMSLPLRYSLISKGFPQTSDYRYHKRIASAIRSRNFTAAHELTKNHILENIPKVLKVISSGS